MVPILHSFATKIKRKIVKVPSLKSHKVCLDEYEIAEKSYFCHQHSLIYGGKDCKCTLCLQLGSCAKGQNSWWPSKRHFKTRLHSLASLASTLHCCSLKVIFPTAANYTSKCHSMHNSLQGDHLIPQFPHFCLDNSISIFCPKFKT